MAVISIVYFLNWRSIIPKTPGRPYMPWYWTGGTMGWWYSSVQASGDSDLARNSGEQNTNYQNSSLAFLWSQTVPTTGDGFLRIMLRSSGINLTIDRLYYWRLFNYILISDINCSSLTLISRGRDWGVFWNSLHWTSWYRPGNLKVYNYQNKILNNSSSLTAFLLFH